MGRPPGRIQHHAFQMRVSDAFLRSVDAWRRKRPDKPSRAQAIRQLVEQALEGSQTNRAPSKTAARKASDLATRTIEKLTPENQTPELKQQAKRRLIQGPKEFRDIRGDQPRRK
jgi:hypothetical protein